MNKIPEQIKEVINDSYPYIKQLNPAQKAVIDSGYLEDDSNYIIAIPTASGKTVLGVMAALQSILKGGKAIYTAPLISIQNEKIAEFKKFEKHGIKVGRHPSSNDLSVMVFESFDGLTRFSWDSLKEVDTLIIDEFHMIGEFTRGPTLECAITRAKIINPSIKIVALSATLNNMDEIKSWLNAKVVEDDYRPVPLNKEVLNTEMFDSQNKNDAVVKVVEKSFGEDSQSLAFVSTRRSTESLAEYVGEKIGKKLNDDERKKFKKVSNKILDVPKAKGSNPTSTCLRLSECCGNGTAFHHAGIFNEQREIVEEEFRDGNLLMISATPSLMYGVNLPSRSVVIRDYTRWTSQGLQAIPVFDYEQMSGRAGRPLYDDVGYSYLIAKSLDEAYELQDKYVNGDIEDTTSKLIENKDAVLRQIIAQIASNLSKNIDEIQDFFNKTFYGYQMMNDPYMKEFADIGLKYEIENSIEFLIVNGIIQPTPKGLKVTKFGDLIAKSNYKVETAVKFKEYGNNLDDLDSNDVIYALSSTPDLPLISFKGRRSKDPVREKLSSYGLFATNVGNPEATTVSLIEWINERNEFEIENAYHVYSASTRRSAYDASMLVKFFKDILEINGHYGYSQQLDILSARLYYGIKEDLIQLIIGIKHLGRKKARTLIETLGDDLRPYTEKDFEKIEGIGPKLSKRIKDYVN
ncbi:MAG: DEAD/DEAH box helicase [Methanobrevibacter sp.]|jgi:helicase|nr:DEAD/DEAH box helicase [Candidatus Methanovirga aequatorialis]